MVDAANSKRKKGSERWMKLQRHKSFDSTTPISEPFNFDPNATFGAAALSSSNPTPDQLLQECAQVINYILGDVAALLTLLLCLQTARQRHDRILYRRILNAIR